MNDFQFISANETYRNLYYQLPKVLFTSEFYKNMSNDSKIAYAMLQDRCEYSIQNNWIDQDGHIYFIFTRNELMDILGCKENKIAKIKKELKDKNLLYEKRIPPKKLPTGEFKNYPNRLYLGKLEVSATDVYAISNASYTNEFPESGKNQSSDKHDKIGVSFESGKNQRPEESNNTSTLFESGKNQPNLYLTNSLDTIDTIDTEKERLQQQLLLDQFSEVQEHTF
ncbi:replication initiator protein A, partial [Enterococcus faecalis]